MLSQSDAQDISQDESIYAQALRAPQYNDDTVQALTQAWIDERHAPELLPYKRTLVNSLLELLEQQADLVMDTTGTNVEHKFVAMVYQTEMERVRYLIKSYLRTRLFKIEKYTLELLRRPDYAEIMSEPEIVYARKYQEIAEEHNHESFVHLLPHSQHKQDEKSGDLNMVISSNLDAPVFCRVLETIGHVELDRTSTVLFEKGDIYILRYRDVKQFLEQGRVQLI